MPGFHYAQRSSIELDKRLDPSPRVLMYFHLQSIWIARLASASEMERVHLRQYRLSIAQSICNSTPPGYSIHYLRLALGDFLDSIRHPYTSFRRPQAVHTETALYSARYVPFSDLLSTPTSSPLEGPEPSAKFHVTQTWQVVDATSDLPESALILQFEDHHPTRSLLGDSLHNYTLRRRPSQRKNDQSQLARERCYGQHTLNSPHNSPDAVLASSLPVYRDEDVRKLPGSRQVLSELLWADLTTTARVRVEHGIATSKKKALRRQAKELLESYRATGAALEHSLTRLWQLSNVSPQSPRSDASYGWDLRIRLLHLLFRKLFTALEIWWEARRKVDACVRVRVQLGGWDGAVRVLGGYIVAY
ncbi:hypothetical protein BJ508DRAFT_366505 [Ascobolus immersus RN42]|uniref:Uncharacterized protein n=1 Tax=Ascobolus immersus RN42 TaxID=1160509 RepID=A0A3N4HIZ9_ASCIM|nr:hypothetical protein BJ508DRAFT_366505 [Ascobolus immersus RN42]